MTFTFDPTLTEIRDKVRFHLGDTNPDAPRLSNELIEGILAQNSNDIPATVLAAFDYVIAQLAQPDFKADWLEVKHADARKALMALRDSKRREFGLIDPNPDTFVTPTATLVSVSRED